MLLSSDPGVGPVQIFVRPERVRVLRANETPPEGASIVSLRVRARRFGGENTEFDLVRVSDGKGEVLRSLAATGPAAVDEIIRITIAAADVRIFPTNVS